MRSRGTWPLVEDWYSVCSIHREYREGCRLCVVGSWRYRLVQKADSLLYSVSPRLWRLWANRPAGRRRLESLMRRIRGERPL